MKMSKIFNLPLYLDSDVVRDTNNDWLVSMDATDEDEAIVIAINHHDELVEALGDLIDGESVHDLVGMTGQDEDHCQKIIDLWHKLKGE